uniref:Uncharacterized protein n=1 Tax=Trypanosoma vivax (strain Y486) TaxID=1055687 RepID=G0U1H9_TRYVY|nr:hypothetical protein, unlikely [Trypanosoma vivax Y486]
MHSGPATASRVQRRWYVRRGYCIESVFKKERIYIIAQCDQSIIAGTALLFGGGVVGCHRVCGHVFVRGCVEVSKLLQRALYIYQGAPRRLSALLCPLSRTTISLSLSPACVMGIKKTIYLYISLATVLPVRKWRNESGNAEHEANTKSW